MVVSLLPMNAKADEVVTIDSEGVTVEALSSGMTVTHWDGSTETAMLSVVVTVPFGTTQFLLDNTNGYVVGTNKFLFYNYSSLNDNDFISGYDFDYHEGVSSQVVDLDANGDGEYDYILIQTPYVTDPSATYGESSKLFAVIQFKCAEEPKDQKITLGAKTSSLTFKAANLKKKKASVSLKATSLGGNLTYKVTKGSKYLTVSKSGKVTLKKGTPKGTYKVKITASKSLYYKQATKTVTIKVK